MSAPAPPQSVVDRRIRSVLDVPLHQFLRVEVPVVEPGRAIVCVPGGAPQSNNVGFVHGGVLYALLDVVCYLALAPTLPETDNAVTHDVHVSVIRPARADEALEFEGRIVKAGRSLVFATSEARAGDKVIATATVTKSRVAIPPPSGRG